ncbi:MAG TPA: sulfotransferase [Steroidobacteraceae bacterium]|nr:sulfotransferase [Steroidobacteraceae bacterium]
MTARPPATADAEAYRLMRAGRLPEALTLARQAVAGKTTCSPTHGVLAMILLRLGRAAEAEAVIESAAGSAPGTGDAYNSLAHVSIALGRHERANALYRRAVELGPDVSRHWFNLASSERSFGRLEQAEAACDRAIELDPTEYRGYLLRSELRAQTPSANHVEPLRRELSRSDLQIPARVLLGYALGKELDDLGRYDEAFEWFAAAAGARRSQLAYDAAIDERKVQRIIEAFPRGSWRIGEAGGADGPGGEVGAGGPGGGRFDDSGRFVFIVGLPRSGTTLVDRILTGLAGVRSNGETDNFERALAAGAPDGQIKGGQGSFAEYVPAAHVDWEAVAAAYGRLADRGSDGTDRGGGSGGRGKGAGGRGAPVVIEKLPLNYLRLGAVHRALPRARLVLVSRAPVDCCFAMYRTLFGDAYPFTYQFEDLARHYAAYAKLIAHWHAAFGDSIHEVRYEELVSDPGRVGAALARACGLEWRDSAVEVERNAGVCLTQSAAQVCRPIYRSSAGSWRRYRTHLEPLIAALRAHGVSLGELD